MVVEPVKVNITLADLAGKRSLPDDGDSSREKRQMLAICKTSPFAAVRLML